MALIEHLSVRGLRNLADLSVGEFGKVNLITGKNNAGKSTLLEAIRILAGGGSTKVLSEIFSSRDELAGLDPDVNLFEDTFLFKNLFTGFPSAGDQPVEFSVAIQGSPSALPRSLRVRAANFERVQ
jgi:ABC-type polysaccharide/polyol phosphate transport system ATPase subunit